jgi:hypothetical protein
MQRSDTSQLYARLGHRLSNSWTNNSTDKVQRNSPKCKNRPHDGGMLPNTQDGGVEDGVLGGAPVGQDLPIGTKCPLNRKVSPSMAVQLGKLEAFVVLQVKNRPSRRIFRTKRGRRPRFVWKMWCNGAIRTSATSSGREFRVQLAAEFITAPKNGLN